MTGSELTRKLRAAGCAFEQRTAHVRVTLGDRFTWLPRHWSKEVKTGTLKAIQRDLGIDLAKPPTKKKE